MELQKMIIESVKAELTSEKLQEIIKAQLVQTVKEATRDALSWNSEGKKAIQEIIKKQVVTSIEHSSKHLDNTNLVSVLEEVIQEVTGDRKAILESFKEFVTPMERFKEIDIMTVFEKYQEFVARYVDTDDLEVACDDFVYEDVSVCYEVIDSESRGYYSNSKVVNFSCEQDEKLNRSFIISNWRDNDEWRVTYTPIHRISDLRLLSEFDVFVSKLNQEYMKVTLTKEHDDTFVTPKAEPTVSVS